MSQLQPYSNVARFDPNWMERILLEISDLFNIQIVWNRETAVLTGVMTVAGGLLGGYTGGRLGAAIGAGIGGATGLGVSNVKQDPNYVIETQHEDFSEVGGVHPII